MKRFLITVLAALTISGAAAQMPFPDVPVGHWAGDAVARIAELGIVIGFPDGTFRGNESFTRYQAALVVSRLLDVIEGRMALTDADLAALRNAVLELTADVAAQDVRLGAVEDAVSVLDRDVMSNTERIAALEAAVALMVDPAAIRDLQNQIDALRVAVDTATARAEAAEALANNALEAVGELDARLADAEAGIQALNELVAILNQDILELKARPVPEIDPAILEDIRRNTADIANIREFVILLRRDQVALRDRVAALEEGQAALVARVDDIDARVAAIERDMLVVSGSITIQYDVVRFGGPVRAFDVDRAFGAGLPRTTKDSHFSAAQPSDRVPLERADFLEPVPGEVDARLKLNIGFSPDRLAATYPNAVQTWDTFLELGLRRVTEPILRGPRTDPDLPWERDAMVDLDGYVIELTTFRTTYSGIGAPPLTFEFGRNIRASFTPYVFDTRVSHRGERSEGFVATMGAPDFLAFLGPTLTVAYGSPTVIRGGDGFTVEYPHQNAYFRAIRGTLSPFEGVTLGGSFAQLALRADDHEDVRVDNITTTVYGVDGTVSLVTNLATFALSGEFAASSTFDAATEETVDATSLFFVKANVETTDLPILETLSANFRSIPAVWRGLEDNERANFRDDTYPFGRDQTGFGVRAGLELFIVDIEAFVDSFSVTRRGQNPDAAEVDIPVLAFGVEPRVDLFAGFSLSGFFRQVTVDGDVVDRLSRLRTDADGRDPADLRRRIDGATRDYMTGFGVGIRHDGAAENALVPNLNISAGYEMIDAGFRTPRIFADADFTLNVAFLTLTPYVGFESISPPDADRYHDQTIRVGAALSTTPLDFFLRPSLLANVNFRQTARSDAPELTPAAFTATVLQYSVGLTLNEFLFENSVLTARYGFYAGTNVRFGVRAEEDRGIRVWPVAELAFRNDRTATTSGFEVVWNYWDLEIGFGSYTFSAPLADAADAGEPVTTAAQAFRIKYRVNF